MLVHAPCPRPHHSPLLFIGYESPQNAPPSLYITHPISHPTTSPSPPLLATTPLLSPWPRTPSPPRTPPSPRARVPPRQRPLGGEREKKTKETGRKIEKKHTLNENISGYRIYLTHEGNMFDLDFERAIKLKQIEIRSHRAWWLRWSSSSLLLLIFIFFSPIGGAAAEESRIASSSPPPPPPPLPIPVVVGSPEPNPRG